MNSPKVGETKSASIETPVSTTVQLMNSPKILKATKMKSADALQSATMNTGSPAAPKSGNPVSQTPTKAKKSKELPVVGIVGGVKLDSPAFTAQTSSNLASSSKASLNK